MANNQPLNTTISVHNRVRTYRQDLRHESAKALVSNGFRGLVVSVPGEEKLVGVTRQSGTDIGVTTSLGAGRGTGLPCVRIPEAFLPVWAAAASSLYTTNASGTLDTTLDFPVRLPGVRDFQIGKKTANVSDNLHASAQARHTGPNR